MKAWIGAAVEGLRLVIAMGRSDLADVLWKGTDSRELSRLFRVAIEQIHSMGIHEQTSQAADPGFQLVT